MSHQGLGSRRRATFGFTDRVRVKGIFHLNDRKFLGIRLRVKCRATVGYTDGAWVRGVFHHNDRSVFGGHSITCGINLGLDGIGKPRAGALSGRGSLGSSHKRAWCFARRASGHGDRKRSVKEREIFSIDRSKCLGYPLVKNETE
jgi:hypothetical protein